MRVIPDRGIAQVGRGVFRQVESGTDGAEVAGSDRGKEFEMETKRKIGARDCFRYS